ncbi:glycosyltransferase family 39 protein [Parabacteroides faecis]|uniref:glycosyltransferase family 39 protein n=1 Tax=Parabacteroides TaxID=375288 RepID=UPI000EFF57B4|nr:MULTISPECIES: glycosyltransferase family 39 protein [Parabacteroides]MBC8616762.1 glycosyltransferase family 39 protein [Parabacteroides faecis]RHR98167.1 hypothetical protein DWW23_11820 [Parabacteroides sp. AF14-59]
MVLYIGIILTFLSGFFFINCLSVSFSLTEKIGLSFPLGLVLETIAMLVGDQLGVSFTIVNLLIIQCIILAGMIAFVIRFRNTKAILKIAPFTQYVNGTNLIWFLFILLIVYIEYMNFSKCIYFPPFDRDSLAGFETIGYVAAQEQTYKGLSLFEGSYNPSVHAPGSYITYAPLVQLSYAYIYTLGANTSKLVPGLMYLSFLFAFYGAAQRATTKTGVVIATFFVLITPEMIAFSSLSMTNVIHAIYASLGIIYLVLWFKDRDMKYLYLSGVLLGANIWCRTEGVVFIVAALFVLFLDALHRKHYYDLFICGLIMIIPALFWNSFMKINGLYAESIAITKLFWDPNKFNTIKQYMIMLYTNTVYYGWSFYLFALMVIANCWFIYKKRDNVVLLVMIAAASLCYMTILYQIDYKWDTIENVLSYSAKRFLFCFIPLVWFYSLTNYWAVSALTKLDQYISYHSISKKNSPVR